MAPVFSFSYQILQYRPKAIPQFRTVLGSAPSPKISTNIFSQQLKASKISSASTKQNQAKQDVKRQRKRY